MRSISVISVLAIGIAQTLAVPSPFHVEHESRAALDDHSWIKRSRLESHVTLPVRIGLKQRNIDNEHGHALLMAISDPQSPKYGQHYTAEEVIELFAPSEESVEAVRQWLQSSGIHSARTSLSANKQWLQFDAGIRELEALLHTTYHQYEHGEHGTEGVACENYYLPKDVQPHIDFIKPGISLVSRAPGSAPQNKNKRDTSSKASHAAGGSLKPKTRPFPMPVEKYQKMSAGSSCDIAVSPRCVSLIYNITDTVTKAPGNSIGVYETEGELYSPKDLNKYLKTFASYIAPGTHPIFKGINGAPKPKPNTFGGVEADLDFQTVYPFVYPDNIINYQVGDKFYETRRFPNGLYNQFLDAIDGSYCHFAAFGLSGDSPGIDPKYPDPHKGGYKKHRMCGTYTPTKVITLSYEQSERELPINYQRRQCLEFMKLGLQGTTVLFASGDEGVAPRYLSCKKNTFNADYPSNCPYVTSVGGTQVPPGAKPVPGVEIATTYFPSGGGFSNIYPRPHYQNATITHYFRNYDPGYKFYKTEHVKLPDNTHGGKYNRIGRAYPDIAAIGQNYAGYTEGQAALFAGTSVATPLVAALITRINNHRLNAGKTSVGFINPTLYANHDMFNDVVKGHNAGCGTKGFFCAPGWDPVTGLGTPNYGKMLEVFMALP